MKYDDYNRLGLLFAFSALITAVMAFIANLVMCLTGFDIDSVDQDLVFAITILVELAIPTILLALGEFF